MEGNCVEYVYSSTRIRRTRAENGKKSWGAREKSGEVGGGRVQDEVLCGCYLGRLLGSLEYPDRSSSTVYFIQLIPSLFLLSIQPVDVHPPTLARPHQLSLASQKAVLRVYEQRVAQYRPLCFYRRRTSPQLPTPLQRQGPFAGYKRFLCFMNA